MSRIERQIEYCGRMRRGRPGPSRTARAVVSRIEALHLNLRGMHVLTEAATGAYAVTPVIAAAAGATVTALAGASRYGTVADAIEQVTALAEELDVSRRIHIVDSLSPDDIGRADIVTNSGHLAPGRRVRQPDEARDCPRADV